MPPAYPIYVILLAATIFEVHPTAAEMVVALGYAPGGPTNGWVYGQSSGVDAKTIDGSAK